MNENVFARPNGLMNTLQLRSRVGDLYLPERRGIPVVVGRKKMDRCALVARQ